MGHAQLRQGPADADYGNRPRRRARALSQCPHRHGLLQIMSAVRKSAVSSGTGTPRASQLQTERDLRSIIETVLRLAKSTVAEETEVHVDETISALTRFANNAIHQNVAEHGLTISVRTIIDGRTARATTNRCDEDSLRP